MADTRERILDVALETLGRDPDAAMSDIAAAAGVVRRTVYGHFPTRADLVRTLTGQAVSEVAAVLAEADASGDGDGDGADAVWVAFVARLWPLMRRYRVLLVLRRGEYGPEIHALLEPVEQTLAGLVHRGQDGGAFGRHLPAEVLSQVAFSAVFGLADTALAGGSVDVRAATITSLLLLGVPESRAKALTDG